MKKVMKYCDIEKIIFEYNMHSLDLEYLYKPIHIYGYEWFHDFVIGILIDENNNKSFLYIRKYSHSAPGYYFRWLVEPIKFLDIVNKLYNDVEYKQDYLIREMLSQCEQMSDIGKIYGLK